MASGFVLAILSCASALAADQSPTPGHRVGPGVEQAVSPLTVDPALAAWAAAAADVGPAHQRFERLLAALRDPLAPGLREQTTPTLAASEAFRRKRINCVSFAFLVVGLARSLDLPAYFVLVPETFSSQSDATLVVEEQHLAAAVALEGAKRIVDFAGDLDPAQLATVPVPDLTAIALFHSNRGVEALAAGHLDRAVAELRWATTLDPTIAVVWVNLGVALRRRGDSDAAELAYQTALALDPRTRAAQVNLSNLLASRGESERAARLISGFRTAGPDPLAILGLAEASLSRGDLATARAHYQRALELSQRTE